MTDPAVPRFSRVYETYHGRVRACVVKLLGAEDADDLTQEIFVKVDRGLGTVTDPAKLTSWIYAVTLNSIRDAARRRAARGGRPAVVAGPGDPGGVPLAGLPDAAARSPEETAIRHEMIACYLEFVERLPPPSREVYVLSEIEDLSAGEIARRLGITPGTVKMRLHRARARLHEDLRRHCRSYLNARGELMGEPKDR